MAWIQIKLHTDAEHVEFISDALMAIGALSVTYEDDADEPLYEPALNTIPLWQQTQIIALFEEETDRELLPVALQAALAPLSVPEYEISLLPDREWERVWMEDFHPLPFGAGLWICPSWQTPPEPEAINLLLDPGLAFGTGTHATTALCLEWIAEQGHKAFTGQTIIDYGCGSGVLGIAAAKFGAQTVWAVDNDPQALLATQDNAQKNQVELAINTVLPEQLPLLQAGGLLANILAGPLIELAPQLAQQVRTGGFIVLSGILQDQAETVLDAYRPFFHLQDPAIKADWVRVVGVRI